MELGEMVMWNLILVHLEIVLLLVQDWCTACAEATKARKSFWTHMMELLGDMDHVECRFYRFGDSVSFGAR
jgi:hypothetical protein